MGAVADRSSVDVELVKSYLRLDGTADDDLLEFLLEAAKDDADDYLGNDFGGGDIPPKVDRWVLKEVLRDYENRPAGLSQQNIAALGNVTWAVRDYSGIASRWEPRL